MNSSWTIFDFLRGYYLSGVVRVFRNRRNPALSSEIAVTVTLETLIQRREWQDNFRKTSF